MEIIEKIKRLLGLSPQEQSIDENDSKNKEEQQVKQRLRNLGYL